MSHQLSFCHPLISYIQFPYIHHCQFIYQKQYSSILIYHYSINLSSFLFQSYTSENKTKIFLHIVFNNNKKMYDIQNMKIEVWITDNALILKYVIINKWKLTVFQFHHLFTPNWKRINCSICSIKLFYWCYQIKVYSVTTIKHFMNHVLDLSNFSWQGTLSIINIIMLLTMQK
jgi:hypothetical protein